MNGKTHNFTTAAIVQARFGSTRLPGKILKEISNKPMLWHVIDRLSNSKLIDKIIIATTNLEEDDQVQAFCELNNILFFRGSSNDVLSRYYETAKHFNVDLVIRITADCPLIDPVVVDNMLDLFLRDDQSIKLDYMSNVFPRTFPRGFDTEIFSFNSLTRAYNEATEPFEREHVTPYIYQHPEKFIIKNFANKEDFSFHRWTVDTQEDLLLIEKIYAALYNEKRIFLYDDIIKLFGENPDLIKINQNLQQKKLGE